MAPLPTPPSPTVPPGSDQGIDISISPPPPGLPESKVDVTVPQEFWDKLMPSEASHCPKDGIGRFLCEHGETLDHVGSGIASVVTAIAVIVGGLWAYRRFVRGRIYHPRSAIEVKTQWHVLAGVGHVLQVRIGVTNIGASKLTLVPSETGVQIDFPSDGQTIAEQRAEDEWWPDVRWEPVRKLESQDQPRTFAILNNHVFIEPSERVFEDILLNLGREPTIVQIRAQLCWVAPAWCKNDNWLYDYVDQIIPPSATIYQHGATAGNGDAGAGG